MKVSFKRWKLNDNRSVAAIFQGCRRGIYVLEFENGERYVGQATNVITRYTTHRHGSKQHKPWSDITAIQFLEVPRGSLDEIEFETIQRYRNEHQLRNKTFNFGHQQPSPLDDFIKVEDQEHWATGQPDYDLHGFTKAAKRPHGETPKLIKARQGQELLPDGRKVWEAIIDDLAILIPLVIPNAIETEGKFWSLSDFPSTSGGRFVTLNVGRLELVYYPRFRHEPKKISLATSNGLTMTINAMSNTFILENKIPPHFTKDEDLYIETESDETFLRFLRLPTAYSVPVDSLMLPLGSFTKDTLTDYEVLGVRKLVIHSMRAGSARLNSRSYSSELIRLIYKRICELNS